MKPVLTEEWFDAHVRAKTAFEDLCAVHSQLKEGDYGMFLVGFLAGIEYCSVPAPEQGVERHV